MAEDTIPGMADAIASRMRSEGLGPGDLLRLSGLSDTQCLEVRAGRRKRYAHKTLRGIAQALRWPLDWYERLLAGEDPAEFADVDWARPASGPGDSTDLNSRVARLEPQDQAYIKDLIDRFERDLEEGR